MEDAAGCGGGLIASSQGINTLPVLEGLVRPDRFGDQDAAADTPECLGVEGDFAAGPAELDLGPRLDPQRERHRVRWTSGQGLVVHVVARPGVSVARFGAEERRGPEDGIDLGASVDSARGNLEASGARGWRVLQADLVSFEGEGYDTPTDQRFCINSVSVKLVPDEG